MKKLKPQKVTTLGMELEQWNFESCSAEFGVNDTEKWATLYFILSKERGKGYATEVLKQAKEYYEKKSYKFGSSVALNPGMEHVLKKLNITEYTQEYVDTHS